MVPDAYRALRKVGAKNPLQKRYRGSFAFLLYTGPEKLSFVKQVGMVILCKNMIFLVKEKLQVQTLF